MFKNTLKRQKLVSFIVALGLHFFAVFLFSILHLSKLSLQKDITLLDSSAKKIDEIKLIDKAELKKYRTVGVKDGVKNSDTPDLQTKQTKPTLPQKAQNPINKKPNLSLDQLAANAPIEKPSDKKASPNDAKKNGGNADRPTENKPIAPSVLSQSESAKYLSSPTLANNEGSTHFYYNPTKGGVIQRSREQDNIKKQASSGMNAAPNPVVNRISNFEIRYDRPEGVSEDELNSDEKAYYSFYVRSYKNYFQKIYATYEKVLLQRPALPRAFESKHVLIGKIDYDENGDIIKIKIIKSSDNDDLHFFFEETLKELNQPNPPRVFTRNKKEFSIYYQLQVN